MTEPGELFDPGIEEIIKRFEAVCTIDGEPVKLVLKRTLSNEEVHQMFKWMDVKFEPLK
jgi:hypothetical protein